MDSRAVIVRRSPRYELVVPARLRPRGRADGGVALSASAPVTDGWAAVEVVDFSTGGAGLMGPLFLPRDAMADLELPSATGDGGGGVVLAVAVRRVLMTDRRPAYWLGVEFVELNEEQADAIGTMSARLEGMVAVGPVAESGAAAGGGGDA